MNCRHTLNSAASLAASITLLAVVVGASLTGAAAASITFSPAEGLLSDTVAVRLTGLRPGARVTVTAVTAVAGQWKATATFLVDASGEVALDRQAPLAGTYQGVNAMGLFTSGQRVEGSAPREAPDVREAVVTTFHLEMEGTAVTTAEYRRRWCPAGVHIRPLQEDGLVGEFYQPVAAGVRPAILVLGGSDGGIERYHAAGLAAQGYAVLALAYFRAPTLKDELVEIPIEYALKAIAWLKRQPTVDVDRLGILGRSRGTELAFLVAASMPELRAVVAFAPSNVTWAGVGKHNAGRPAWLHQGRALPTADPATTADTLRAAGASHPAAIPIERSQAAYFLVTGSDDRIWPRGAAPVMAEMVVARLAAHRHSFPVEHWTYARAGHSIGMFQLPGPILSGGGGLPEANATAVADLTPRLFAFLKKHLRP